MKYIDLESNYDILTPENMNSNISLKLILEEKYIVIKSIIRKSPETIIVIIISASPPVIHIELLN